MTSGSNLDNLEHRNTTNAGKPNVVYGAEICAITSGFLLGGGGGGGGGGGESGLASAPPCKLFAPPWNLVVYFLRSLACTVSRSSSDGVKCDL